MKSLAKGTNTEHASVLEDAIDHVGDKDVDKRRRRRAKEDRRRAKKLADRLAALGLDETGEPLDNYSLLKYPVREWKFKVPGGSAEDIVAINPVVTLLCVISLWALVAWNTMDHEGASRLLVAGRTHVSSKFVWFYQLVKMIMLAVLMYIAIRFGNIRLGQKQDVPEFSNVTYICMTFAPSVGTSLLAYAVSDPMSHRQGNFFANAGYRSQDEIDMFAINMPATTWGVGGFIGIAVVAICMSLAVYRFNLPMTFRSCFYPILGAYTWGWMGDFIDALSIIVTVASMCTMMGTTAIQVVTGLKRLGLLDKNVSEEEIALMQNVAIWVITIVSTVAVIKGLRGGIQFMAVAAVSVGVVLTFLVLVLDDSRFLLNLTVQEIGYFLQHSMIQLNFWTDAFGQLREGSGRAVDDKAADETWMDVWMMYYYAWSFSFSCILGAFVAYISKGRTIRDVVLCSFVGPVFFCVVFCSIWGGIGLRQLRQAMELMALGEKHFNNSAHLLADGSEICYDVPQEDIVVGDATVFTNHLPGVSPVCLFDPANPSYAMYNVLDSFHLSTSLERDGLSAFLSVLFVLGCAIFYSSHCDSATFIVDTMASNGRKNYHWTRRMFWSGTIAALTTALLSSNGANALAAVGAATIVGSLPVTILLVFLLQSIFLLCQAADKLEDSTDGTEYEFPDQPGFPIPLYGGIFNAVEYVVSLGRVNAARVELGMHQPTSLHIVEFIKGLVVPFVPLHQVLCATYPQNPNTNAALVACYALLYATWVCLSLSAAAFPGLGGLAVTAFVLAGAIVGLVRSGFRLQYNIRSNCIADLCGGLFLWPQVLAQMRMEHLQPHANKSDKRSATLNRSDFDEEADA